MEWRGLAGQERGWGGGTDRQWEKWGKGAFCLVISSRSLPSGAVVRLLSGRPEGPRAYAEPPTRQHSGPGFHLGYSGRSS